MNLEGEAGGLQFTEALKASILGETIVKLVSLKIPMSGFPTNKILWGLTVYLETGRVSNENANAWHRVSNDVLELKRSEPYKLWRPKTIFEHCKPLSIVYEELLGYDGIDLRTALQIIGEYPPILITRDQNMILERSGFRSTGDPEIRYKDIELAFDLKSEKADAYIELALEAQSYRRTHLDDKGC